MSVIKLDEPRISHSLFFFSIMLWMYVQLQDFTGTFSRLFQHGSIKRTECRIQHKCITSTADSSSWTLIRKQKSWQSASAEHKERWIIRVIAHISSSTGQKPSTQHVPQSIQSPLRRIIEWKLNYTNRHLREDNNLA